MTYKCVICSQETWQVCHFHAQAYIWRQWFWNAFTSLSGRRATFVRGDGYAGLSKMACITLVAFSNIYLLAFTNPTTNSYKRLVPGFERQ